MVKKNRREFIMKVLTAAAASVYAFCRMPGRAVDVFSSLSSPLSSPLFAADSSSFNVPSETSGDSQRMGMQGKEAMHYVQVNANRVNCRLCARNCTISEGETGFCRVRDNRKGKLYSVVYGVAAGLQFDPVEMEPMYHMIPGHRNLCVYTASCNFRCKHCHNWHISQRGPDKVSQKDITPLEVVKRAKDENCKSISHSINEPAVFYEYMYDIARLAKKEGLLTLFHTNGYLSPDPLREVLKYMDGVTVDLKAFTDEFYGNISEARVEPVLDTLRIIKEENVHLEIVNLVIPTLNDDPEDIKNMCTWIRDELGDSVPLHFNRFTPTYKLTDLASTPVETLETAAGIAYELGMKYVYIGNLPGHEYNSTYCPQCDKRLIHRTHYNVLGNDVKDGKCSYCGFKIEGIWESA